MRLTRRRRLVAFTSAAAVIGLLSIGGFVWAVTRPDAPYRPGQEIAGLTSNLARDIPADYHRAVTFVDVAATAGIRFHHFGGTRSSQLPEDMGSGAAWGDFDRDGLPDLYLVNIAGPLPHQSRGAHDSATYSTLYRNNGDGTFTDVGAAAGVARHHMGMGAAWADYDNDGWLDLVVTVYGTNTLFRNRGDGTFADVTERAGLGEFRGFWAGASWADADRDGHLDLYITGYVQYAPLGEAARSSQYDVAVPATLNPSTFPAERNLFFRNNGDGTFSEIAQAVGVLGDRGRSLSAAWTDVDDDGWPDLYVANDVSDNVLYRNRGNGTFEEVSHAARVADYRGAMGLAVGDWDNDADTDLFVTHWIAQENALYTSLRSEFARQPRPPANLTQFMDEAEQYGLGQASLDYVGWGTFFFDFDNDTRLDLFVANGHTLEQSGRPERLVPMRDQLFWNRGPDDGFYDVSQAAGAYFASPFVGRGSAYADYDDDGDLDVVVVNHGGPAVLLRNEGGNRLSWLNVRLEGRRSNRDGIGAKVRVITGTTVQRREVGAQSSYLSQNARDVHVGLGEAALVDTLEIVWPSGVRQILTHIPARQTLHVMESWP